MLPLTLDVTGSQWCGINDGYARTLAQCTCLEKQQQVQCDLCLPLNEAVVGKPMWEVTTHMLADIPQIEGLEVSETVGMEQNQNGHDFTVRHTGSRLWCRLPGT